MLNDLKKTTIAVLSVLLFIVLAFAINNMVHKKNTEVKYLDLTVSEEEITKLIEPLNQTSIPRTAYLSTEIMNDETIIKFLFENLNYDELETREIQPQKIICQVNDKISFVSSNVCNIKVVPNEELNNLSKKFFNITRDIEYKDFTYNGLNCQNDNTAYYCTISPYTNTKRNYSFIADVYETKEELTIYEYYLSIDFANKESCLKLFGRDICDNIKELKELPSLDNDTIKEKGVLYKHTFKMGEDGYYFQESTIETM